MELRQQIQFDDARIVSLTRYPGEKGIKAVLILSASFMPEHAEAFGWGYVYKDGVPVRDLEDTGMKGELRDIELRLPNAFNIKETDVYSPELVYKFKLKRLESDAKYEISFRVHEYSRSGDFNDLLDSMNKGVFDMSLTPKQIELQFAGGTRVEMSETAPKRGRGRPKKEKPAPESFTDTNSGEVVTITPGEGFKDVIDGSAITFPSPDIADLTVSNDMDTIDEILAETGEEPLIH